VNGTKANPRRPGRRKLFFRDLVGPALQAKRLRGNSDASLAKDEQRLGRLLTIIGSVPAREITPGIIERALEALARGDHSDGPLKGSTVNRYHSAVSSVLRYAARQGFIGSNPLADGGVPWSKEQKVHVRFLSAGEEARLLKVIRADCPDKEPELMLAVLTGMRRSEQYSVKWEDWSPEAGILHVVGKTGAREAQVNQAARECLELLRKRAPDGQIYITPEANECAADRRTWFEKAVKKAELRPAFRWRDLRHTFASRAALAGVPLLTIQQLCGHLSFETTLKYAHLSPDHRRQAVERVGMYAGGSESSAAAGTVAAEVSPSHPPASA
jgi:integrase